MDNWNDKQMHPDPDSAPAETQAPAESAPGQSADALQAPGFPGIPDPPRGDAAEAPSDSGAVQSPPDPFAPLYRSAAVPPDGSRPSESVRPPYGSPTAADGYPTPDSAQPSYGPQAPSGASFDGTNRGYRPEAYNRQAYRSPDGDPAGAQNGFPNYSYSIRSPYDDDTPKVRPRKKHTGLIVFIVVVCLLVLTFVGGITLLTLMRSNLGAALGLVPATTASQRAENPIKPPEQSTAAASTAATTVFRPVENAPSIEIREAPPRTTAVPVYDESGMRVLTINEIYRKVVPSVVGVVTQVESSLGSGTSLGSGIIMSEDGFILTNAHVVEEGTSFTVILDDKSEYEASVIASDKKSDIAVLKIEASGLPAAEFGDSDALEVGDLAVAIGNPSSLDLAGTTTSGIISAVNREIIVDASGNKLRLIQTDAAINPGNSGGPLLNCYGQVIGISTVKLNSSTYEGLCFAIPTNVFKPIVDELMQYGQVSGYPSIGITGKAVDQYRSQAYNIPMGVLVASVSEASGAYAAGIQAGDVITAVNGEAVYSVSDINVIKNTFRVGDTLTLTIYRDGNTMDLEVRLVDETELK